MNTNAIKEMLVDVSNNDKRISYVLEANEYINSKENWKRKSKEKIKSSYLDMDYLTEQLFDPYISSFPDDDGMDDTPVYNTLQSKSDLLGCTLRTFGHAENEDCEFHVITDKEDSKVVAWFFNID